ncbi:hypothetical protein BGZ49_002559 [Haplosporangium sp. Z 27]|nr:hypothetical protein BGZ49_002559 [Haplosporangium sp. Z 27]
MAHLGNEPWDIQATNLLLNVDHENALEQGYYGPYNIVLNLVFPFHEHYMDAPQTLPPLKEAVDYLFEYLILINNRTVMGMEIKREMDFNYLHKRTEADRQIIDDFKKETAALMQAKYTNHWDPQRPHYGNGYRAITSFGGKVDPLLCEAAQKSSLPVETLHQLIPNDLVLWVEPFNVSYRVGDHGTINTVYDGSRGKVSMKSENSPIQQKMPSRAVRLSPASPPFPSRVSYAIPITCPNTKTQLITPSATPSPPAGKLSVVAV